MPITDQPQTEPQCVPQVISVQGRDFVEFRTECGPMLLAIDLIDGVWLDHLGRAAIIMGKRCYQTIHEYSEVKQAITDRGEE